MLEKRQILSTNILFQKYILISWIKQKSITTAKKRNSFCEWKRI